MLIWLCFYGSVSKHLKEPAGKCHIKSLQVRLIQYVIFCELDYFSRYWICILAILELLKNIILENSDFIFLLAIGDGMGDSQEYCEWQFSVRATTIPGEVVAVVGSCPALGEWMHQKAIELVSGEEGWVIVIKKKKKTSRTSCYIYLR